MLEICSQYNQRIIVLLIIFKNELFKSLKIDIYYLLLSVKSLRAFERNFHVILSIYLNLKQKKIENHSLNRESLR